MSQWNVTIHKRFIPTLQSWGNRYVLEAASRDAAEVSAADIILVHEKAMHSELVEFTSILVSSVTAFDSDFNSFPVGGTGTITSADETVPIETVVECRVNVLSGGRNLRKFYHVCPDRTHLDANQRWDTELVGTVEAEISDLISDLHTATTDWVSPAGHRAVGAVTIPEYRYHQFTKASKRPPAGP